MQILTGREEGAFAVTIGGCQEMQQKQKGPL
jgi:hypothetical protein